MRQALVALLLLLPLVPATDAQAGAGPQVTLTIDVQDTHEEEMTLVFDGLRRLTSYRDLCLPMGARESSVRDGLGEVPYEGRDEDGRRVVTFTAREEKVTILMARAAPASRDRPLFNANANFCVPTEASVKVVVRVPEDHTLFFLSDRGVIQDGRVGTVEKKGPTHVFYSYEAPLAGTDMQAFDVPPFRVLADAGVAVEAQEAARLAVGPLQAALDEAGLETPFDAIRILYQEETPYAWEAGHYNGYGYVAVKEDTLVKDETAGWPLKAVKILVHESFHAASFPYGSGHVTDTVSWFLEGSAKHSERHADLALPNATSHCERSATEVKCWSFDDRIARADLETGYSPTFTFSTGWEPSAPQSDDTRTFYYAYTAYVVGAWIERHGADAYRVLWDDVQAAFERGEGCPCGEGWLVGLLDDDALFTPWEDVHAADPDRFETLVKPLVKDEAALQRELDAQAGPLGIGVPLPPWVAFLALAVGVAITRRRSG